MEVIKKNGTERRQFLVSFELAPHNPLPAKKGPTWSNGREERLKRVGRYWCEASRVEIHVIQVFLTRQQSHGDLTDTSISFPDFFTKRNKFVHILRIYWWSSATVQLAGGGGGIPTKKPQIVVVFNNVAPWFAIFACKTKKKLEHDLKDWNLTWHSMPNRVQRIWLFFRKWRIQNLWWVQNGNLRHIYKIRFLIFWAVFCAFGFKVCKKC